MRIPLCISVYLLALLCGTVDAAPAPVFKEPPPPHFSGWYVMTWNIPDADRDSNGEVCEAGWWGEFLPDGRLKTPGNPCGMGQARWAFDKKTRLLTIEWPSSKARIVVPLDAGVGHQLDGRDNSITCRIEKFVMKRYIPTK